MISPNVSKLSPQRPHDKDFAPRARVVGALAFFAVTALAAAGCATNVDPYDDEEIEASESELTGRRTVSLKYEGTCDFLRSCSKYSKNLPPGKVTWGCTGVGVCSDTALWVAGPNRSYCGKTVKICKGSQCTNALVKDVSVTRDWEASNGVLDAIDLPHGLTGRCSGYGGGKVTVEVGAKASSTDAPESAPKTDDDDDAKGAPEPTTDDGCYSASLEKDMPELSCVQSKTTLRFYQCKSGKWYRGVSGDDGPYGDCEGVHPL